MDMLISLTTNHFTMYIKASCYTPYKQTILKKKGTWEFWGQRGICLEGYIVSDNGFVGVCKYQNFGKYAC